MINLEKLRNYKREITFLIDRKGKIYYHNIDLFRNHEDLLIENQLKENEVCRLVYDPNSLSCEFCGIPGISASCNVLFDALPFELKSTHLQAIERFVSQYEEIVDYAVKHEDEYEPSDPAEQYMRTMNKLRKEDIEKRQKQRKRNIALWEKWSSYHPILNELNKDEEIDKLIELDMVGEFFEDRFAIKEHFEDLIEKAENVVYDRNIRVAQGLFIEHIIEQTENSIKYGRKINLPYMLEAIYKYVPEGTEFYWERALQGTNTILGKIVERAIELDDQPLLELLRKLELADYKETNNENIR